MKPEYEPKTLREAMGYMSEECGELISALGKTTRWGWASTNPDLPPIERITNAQWVANEMKDVEVAIERLRKFMAEELG